MTVNPTPPYPLDPADIAKVRDAINADFVEMLCDDVPGLRELIKDFKEMTKGQRMTIRQHPDLPDSVRDILREPPPEDQP